MNHYFRSRYTQIVVLGLSILFLYGCASGPATQSVERPTSSPSPSATVASSPSLEKQPEFAVQTILTAAEANVTVLQGENAEEQLSKDEVINLPIGERIKMDSTGRGILEFNGLHKIEIYGGTEILIDEAKEESGGSTFVRLKQIAGHLTVQLNEQGIARLTLETENSTITTLEQGTVFTVCYAPEKVTCIVVQAGVIEVTSENERILVKDGKFTYFTPGQTPQPPMCVLEDEFNDWLSRKWGPGDTEALGALVSSWPQEPCGEPDTTAPEVQAGNLPDPQGMVRIEAGSFEIGSVQPDDYHHAQQEITLNEYWIDAYEVTNSQYQQYLDSTGGPPPVVWPGQDSYPVQGVSWDQALAYCRWSNKRLPTEAEWEVAGRGPGSNPPIYPWGDDPFAGGSVDDLPRTETYAVGTMTFNQSPSGVYDLVGNVWEWVDEPYGQIADGNQILRGGRHGLLRDLAYRQPTEPDNERFILYAGFRCASEMVEGE